MNVLFEGSPMKLRHLMNLTVPETPSRPLRQCSCPSFIQGRDMADSGIFSIIPSDNGDDTSFVSPTSIRSKTTPTFVDSAISLSSGKSDKAIELRESSSFERLRSLLTDLKTTQEPLSLDEDSDKTADISGKILRGIDTTNGETYNPVVTGNRPFLQRQDVERIEYRFDQRHTIQGSELISPTISRLLRPIIAYFVSSFLISLGVITVSILLSSSNSGSRAVTLLESTRLLLMIKFIGQAASVESPLRSSLRQWIHSWAKGVLRCRSAVLNYLTWHPIHTWVACYSLLYKITTMRLRFLPLVVQGQDVKALADTSSLGVNAMSRRMANQLDLKIRRTSCHLRTAVGEIFSPYGTVTATCHFANILHTLDFEIIDPWKDGRSDIIVGNNFLHASDALTKPDSFMDLRLSLSQRLSFLLGNFQMWPVTCLKQEQSCLRITLETLTGKLHSQAPIDTGSDLDAISLESLIKSWPKGTLRLFSLFRPNVLLPNRRKLPIIGELECDIWVGSKIIRRIFSIVPGLEQDIVLGHQFWQDHEPFTRYRDHITKVPVSTAEDEPTFDFRPMTYFDPLNQQLYKIFHWVRHPLAEPPKPKKQSTTLKEQRMNLLQRESRRQKTVRDEIEKAESSQEKTRLERAEQKRHGDVLQELEVYKARIEQAEKNEAAAAAAGTGTSTGP